MFLGKFCEFMQIIISITLCIYSQAAYDKWLKAKFVAKKRHDELNAKRRKLKECKVLLTFL